MSKPILLFWGIFLAKGNKNHPPNLLKNMAIKTCISLGKAENN